jgi:HEPN domain-containing protein
MSKKGNSRPKRDASRARPSSGSKSTRSATRAVDPRDIFMQATRFRNTCVLVASALPQSDIYGVPLTFLHALAIELYLKCLLHLTGKPGTDGHELKRELFDELDESTKQRVVRYYKEELPRDPLLLHAVARCIAAGETDVSFEIESVLERINNIFRTIRYLYEGKAEVFPKVRGYSGTVGMDDVLRAIERVILEIEPDWSNIVPDYWRIEPPLGLLGFRTDRMELAVAAMSTPCPVDPHAVFIQALRFRHTSQLVGSAAPLSPDAYIFPLEVLQAFTAELYLKCLLHLTGRPHAAKGHQLKKLFDSLDDPSKKEMIEYYKEESASNPMIPGLLAALAQEGEMAQFDIDSVFEQSNDAFTKLRYWHEDKAGVFGKAATAGLDDVVRATHRIVLERQRDWEKDIPALFIVTFPPGSQFLGVNQLRFRPT